MALAHKFDTSKHDFDPSVLREYDIRGIVGKNIHESDAYAIGRSFGTILKRQNAKVINVGFDGRESSIPLSNAVIQGILDCGLNVINVGLCPSPLTYFSVYHLKSDASVMITGSHNPAEYNGFKFTIKGKAFYGDSIIKIGQLASSGDWETGKGTVSEKDIYEAYIDRIAQDYTGKRKLKIAWDAGNGATGVVLKRLVDKIPGDHVLLFEEVDGNFPNHHPDPTVAKNLQDLIKVVKEQKCDLGVAFDGDGDRIGAVDEHGNIIWCDQLIALYAKDVLKRHPGATIIADVKSSQALFDEIARLGGKPIMWKTGHSLIKSKMAEENSPLSGELSGHIFFGDGFYGYDDGLYCALRLINIVAQDEGSLFEKTKHLPRLINTPEIRFEVDETKKFAIITDVENRLKNAKDVSVNAIDGVRVQTPDGWWLLRASNTQNVLVARAESKTEEGLNRLKKILIEQLNLSGIQAPDELL